MLTRTHTHTRVGMSKLSAWECDIRVLTKTSWPLGLRFNKLQLRVDTVSMSVCLGWQPWWHKAASMSVYFFISCSCEADFPLKTWRLGGQMGVQWRSMCVRSLNNEKLWTQSGINRTCCWLRPESELLPLPPPALSPQLWVIKLKGKRRWGGRVRGGNRALTHRLSNGFQRSLTPRLCAAQNLMRSDG